MTVEEAMVNAEKCLEAFEVRDIIKQQQETINRQKAEIQRLQSILLKFVREINNFENKHNIDTSDFSLIPILEEEKNNLVKQIKAEAIKEFADLSIKNICKNVTPIPQQKYLINMCIKEIEKTKKEMVGES